MDEKFTPAAEMPSLSLTMPGMLLLSLLPHLKSDETLLARPEESVSARARVVQVGPAKDGQPSFAVGDVVFIENMHIRPFSANHQDYFLAPAALIVFREG